MTPDDEDAAAGDDPRAGDHPHPGHEPLADADAAGDEGSAGEPAAAPAGRWMGAVRLAVLPAALLVGVLILIVRARATLEQTPRFLVDPSVCSVMARPAWVSDPVARSIALAVATSLGRQASLLDGSQLRHWADVLTDPDGKVSPWIESVERLEPRFPYQADLRILVRVPVMEVEGLLVAASGHVLGPGPVAVTPVPLVYDGRHLDEDYVECAAACGELRPWRAELESAGVRIVGVGTAPDGTVTFRTDGNVLLGWGRSARKSPWSHLDLPPHERLGNLRQVLVDFPGLQGVGRVQLWMDRPEVELRGS